MIKLIITKWTPEIKKFTFVSELFVENELDARIISKRLSCTMKGIEGAFSVSSEYIKEESK